MKRLPLFPAILLAALPATPAHADVATHADDDTFALEAAALLPKTRLPRAAPAQPADAANAGRWGSVIPWTPHIPVSAANLPDGRILTFASNQRTSFPVGPEFTYAATWDPATGGFLEVNHPSHDLFCGGLAILPDGGVMVAGGRNSTVRNSVFDWRTNTWQRNPDMNGGRWYNTAVALDDGQVFTATGSGTGQNTAERWNGSSWITLTGIAWQDIFSDPGYATNWHPFLSLAPDGRLIHFGPSDRMHWIDPAGSGSLVSANTFVPGNHYPKEGAWVMYDEGRILVAGGAVPDTGGASGSTAWTSTNLAYTVDIRSSTPAVTAAAPMEHVRQFANAVVLPSGEVLIMGGNTSGLKFNDTGSVLPCEIWNPRTERWRTVAGISVPRNYHSVALLLPDGRVWLGGGGLGGGDHQDAQLYTPPGLLTDSGTPAARPVLTAAPASIVPGSTFTVTGSPDIVQFALIKMSALTHSVNTDLRRIVISYTEPAPGEYQLSAPAGTNVVPPGYWMLFALNQSGVCSVSRVIRVETVPLLSLATPPPQTGAVDTPVSLTLTAAGKTSAAKTVSAAGLPPGMVLNASSGVISGIPTEPGHFNVTATASTPELSVTVSFPWSILGGGNDGVLQHEWWSNISGAKLAALTSHPDYPQKPSGTGTLTSFEAPVNAGDNLGRRVRGWLRPEVTGSYRFWIASDDESRLLLSSDASSANAVSIARVPASTGQRQWTKSSEQASLPVSLTAGNFYYIEALMKEGTGGDHLAVAWRPPGGTGQTVIPASALTLRPAASSPAVILTNPGPQTAVRGTPANLQPPAPAPDNSTLTWTAQGLPPGLAIDSQSGYISGIPAAAGAYRVSLRVSDGIHTSAPADFTWTINDPVTVTVAGQFPAAAGTVVHVTAAGSGGSSPSFSWSWGDGTPDSAASSSPAAAHTWAAPGRYRVIVSVTDGGGRTAYAQYYQGIHAPLTSRRPSQSSPIACEDRITGNDRIWSVNPDHDSVSAFDSVTRVRLAEIPTGAQPHSVAAAPDGRVWVVNTGSATISIIDPAALSAAATVHLPPASRPFGLAFDPDGSDAWIACEGSGQLLRLNPLTGGQTGAVQLGLHIRHVSVDASSTRVFVSRFITPRLPGEESASVQTGNAGGEVIAVLSSALTVERTIRLQHSEFPDSHVSGRGIPNYLGVAAVSPDGLSAWIAGKQDNIKRGMLRDGSQLTPDLSVRSITSRLDLSAGTPLTDDLNSRMDHDNAGIAVNTLWDPFGIYVFTALEGSRAVSVMDAWNRRELMRFETGRAPQGLALSPDGGTLYVQNFMDRSITVHDLDGIMRGLETPPVLQATLSSSTGERLAPEVLRGKQLFYDSKDPRNSLQEYISCAACHSEGGEDGRVWDFTGSGEGLRNTISLRGRSGTGHGPLHWSGNFDEVQDFENQIRDFAGGTGLIADGSPHPPMGTPNAGRSADLDALAAYVASLTTEDPSPHRNADGTLTAAAQAGRMVFIQQNCAACHSGTAFTGSALNLFSDIGTLKPSSGGRLGGPLPGIDIPTLRGLWNSPPYLHDGSAATLSAAVSAHQGISLNPADMANLAAYLLEIDEREAAAPTAHPSVTTAGLKAEYFNGRNFDHPVLTRTDATVNFDWGTGAPAPGVDADNFSVRWGGAILPAYSGDYTFVIAVDNGVRLRVNSALLINSFGEDAGGWFTGTARLSAGVPAPFSIEYKEEWGNAGIVVYWYSDTQPWEILPAARLQTAGGIPPAGTTGRSQAELEAAAARIYPTLRIEAGPGNRRDVVFTLPPESAAESFLLEYSGDLSRWDPWPGSWQRIVRMDGSTAVRTPAGGSGTAPAAGFFRVRVH